MIVSHKYKFIFLKTNKTAGTSVEIALSKFCGEDDIITPIVREDERQRKKLGYRGRQNYYLPGCQPSIFARLLLRKNTKPDFYNHMPARELKPLLGDAVWNSYYKFCFERNPWDRLVSQYYWKNQHMPRPSISEFLRAGGAEGLKEKGRGVYTIDNQVVVDKIYLFEDMQNAIADIQTKLQLPEALVLPNAKGGFRQDRRHYSQILTAEEKAFIETLFQQEIAMLGYQFDPL